MGRDKNVETLKEEFKDFFEKFPTIFNKVVDGTMEMGRLKFMLKMINEIERKKYQNMRPVLLLEKNLLKIL